MNNTEAIEEIERLLAAMDPAKPSWTTMVRVWFHEAIWLMILWLVSQAIRQA